MAGEKQWRNGGVKIGAQRNPPSKPRRHLRACCLKSASAMARNGGVMARGIGAGWRNGGIMARGGESRIGSISGAL